MTAPRTKVLLFIDKDQGTLKSLKKMFLKEKFLCFFSKQFRSSEEIFVEYKPDLVCIDFDTAVSWKTDIYKLLKDFKRINPNTKILLFYSIQSSSCLMDSLHSGIDGYLRKPFTCIELFVYILRILSFAEFDEYVEYHGLRLYIRESFVIYNGIKVFLSEKDAEILKILLNSNIPLSIESVSRDLNSNINASRMCINRLVKKLERCTGRRIIKCRYGVGYYIAI